MRLNSPTLVFLLTFITTLAFVPSTFAQATQIATKSCADSNDTATSRGAVLAENTCAAPFKVVSAERRKIRETQSDKIEHLRGAVKHLKAVGTSDGFGGMLYLCVDFDGLLIKRTTGLG